MGDIEHKQAHFVEWVGIAIHDGQFIGEFILIVNIFVVKQSGMKQSGVHQQGNVAQF
jgi:hypothetical protein